MSYALASSYIQKDQVCDDMYRILLAAITDINLSLPSHQKLQIVRDIAIKETLIVAQGERHLSRHRAQYPHIFARIWAHCTLWFANDKKVTLLRTQLNSLVEYTKSIPL